MDKSVIKLVFMVGISIALLIPLGMLKSTIAEREQRLRDVEQSLAKQWTGSQTMITPVLAFPSPGNAIGKGFYKQATTTGTPFTYHFPTDITIEVQVNNKNPKRGIYRVPVYDADIIVRGSFSVPALSNTGNTQRLLDENSTHFMMFSLADSRGIQSQPQLTIGDRRVSIQPGSSLGALSHGLRSESINEMSTLANAEGAIPFRLQLTIRGMKNLDFVPLSQRAAISLSSDWPHPAFSGSLLPHTREISDQGFDASWSANEYSNASLAVFETCVNEQLCQALLQSGFGVEFVTPVDIYLQSERAIKYALLFIGLSFISYFLFETLKPIRIHPVQYAFVGFANAVFYLLLISLAEHMAFAGAYALAALACSLLLFLYTHSTLKSLLSASLFLLMLVGLYGLLFIIIRAEDFALLMGSCLVFIVLATLMISTRDLDWYRLGRGHKDSEVGTDSPIP